MKKLIDLIQEELVKAFTAAEMDPSYARVSVSNRPDLCEYQCNGAMAAAKAEDFGITKESMQDAAQKLKASANRIGESLNDAKTELDRRVLRPVFKEDLY